MIFCSRWNSVPIPVVKFISLKREERSDETHRVTVVLAATLPGGCALLNASNEVAFSALRVRVTLSPVRPWDAKDLSKRE